MNDVLTALGLASVCGLLCWPWLNTQERIAAHQQAIQRAQKPCERVTEFRKAQRTCAQLQE